jgi:plasmid stabilization system protein ParE
MVKWTPKSEDDLDNLREHIAEHFNVELAIKIANTLVDYTEEILSENPLAGKLFEYNPLFSKLIYQGNTIYYCDNPADKNIYIIYVQCRGMQFKNERLLDKL